MKTQLALFFIFFLTSYSSLAQDNSSIYQATFRACQNFRHDLAAKGYTYYQIPKSPEFNKIIIEIFEESASNPSRNQTPKLRRLIDNSGFQIAMDHCYPTQNEAANKKLFIDNLVSVDKGGLINNLGQFAGITLVTLPLGFIKGVQLINWISKASLAAIAAQLSWAGYRFVTQPNNEITWTQDKNAHEASIKKEAVVSASRQAQKQSLQSLLDIKRSELSRLTSSGTRSGEVEKLKDLIARLTVQIEIIDKGL